MRPLKVHAFGESASVRGIEMVETETEGSVSYPKLYAHIQYTDDVETKRVPVSALKIDGGLSRLHGELHERGMVPDWYYDGYHSPEQARSEE